MRATLCSKVQVIPGRVITRQDPLTGLLKAAGVFLLGRSDMARLKAGGQTILLHGVKIIVRASGRKARHLARYLVGVSDQGTYHEVFLEVIQGVRGALFGARVAVQQGLLRVASALLGPGLSARQKAAMVV